MKRKKKSKDDKKIKNQKVEMQSRGYAIAEACKVMNVENIITMRNNRRCRFIISRSRVT